MRVQQLRCFAVLKFHEWYYGTIQNRQDATVRLISGVEVSRMVLWRTWEYSNGSLPMGQPPQWKC
eukprot:1108423-Pyramimonas_sp.AAC.1